MRLAIGVVALVAGLALFVVAYRTHRRHPERNMNTGPQVLLYAAGFVLAAIGLAGIAISATR